MNQPEIGILNVAQVLPVDDSGTHWLMMIWTILDICRIFRELRRWSIMMMFFPCMFFLINGTLLWVAQKTCCKTSVLESYSPQYFHAVTNMSQSSTADMIEKKYPKLPVEIQEMLDIPPVNSLHTLTGFKNLWFFHVNWVLPVGMGWEFLGTPRLFFVVFFL